MNISLSYVNLNNKYLDNGILLKQRYLIKTKENILESLPGGIINNKQESFNYKGLNITLNFVERGGTAFINIGTPCISYTLLS